MSRRRPGVLKIGDRVRFDEQMQTVTGISGTLVYLATERGVTSVVALPHLLTQATIEGAPTPARPATPVHGMAGISDRATADALWWESHILEVIAGLGPDAALKAKPRPEYDPVLHTLAERERAKAAELAGTGRRGVSVANVRRKRRRYEAQGLPGLVDWRTARTRSIRGRTDQRVVTALQRAIEEATDNSSRTVEYFRWLTEQIVMAEYGPGSVAMPSRSTFYASAFQDLVRVDVR